MKILVVDDSKMVRNAATKMLVSLGHTVDMAESGKDCLEKLSGSDHELVFLDWEMPEMDGIQTLNALKASHQAVQVIMLTGHSDMDKVMAAIELGALDFIIKPFTLATFSEKIKEHF